MKNRNLTLSTTLFALGCFAFGALLPRAQAVVPAPDGGYPGGNTAEGQAALLSLTTGFYNTAVGIYSVLSLTDGSFCTGVGAGTLLVNTADNSTAIGAGALLSNTVGEENTATGAFALFSNTEGDFNTATGAFALLVNTTGERNTATGDSAMFSNTIGSGNTATGNAALGFNTTGGQNTATGASALFSNTIGSGNTATGVSALQNNITGASNTAHGYQALFSNTGGSDNIAIGFHALFSSTTNDGNTAIGAQALSSNTTGGFNIALGFNAGVNLTTGDNNIDIGSTGIADESSTIRIGTSVTQTRAFIAGIRGVTTVNAAIPVVIDTVGQLGTMSSSRRFKKEIKPMDSASEAILALKPVTFHYKSDNTNRPEFGLIAEEVAEVNPDLVVRDENGEIYTVRYDAVNAMLLNEFLKEHKTVQEQNSKIQQQEATIAQLKKDFRATVAQLTTRLDEQAAQIQKVSAQLEASKLEGSMVLNNP
jgi:hypothetical protein